MPSSSLTIVQPLHSLPSLLAIRDLRSAVLTSRCIGGNRDDAVALLAVDPLAALRALRLASAPVWAPVRGPESLEELVATLGSPAVMRLLEVPPVEIDRTNGVRSLWLHSIATGCAAEQLAKSTGAARPEQAYYRGLLRDLSPWLKQLGIHHDGSGPDWSGNDLVRLWRLPLPNDPRDGSEASPQSAQHPDDPLAWVRLSPEQLVDAADLLASLAGFVHLAAPPVRPADDEALRAAIEQVKADVGARLARVGLDIERVRTPRVTPDDERSLFTGTGEANLTELVARLLDCRQAPSYSAAATLCTAAALRFLDFDRAFMVTWNPACRRVWVRAKADLTELGLVRRPIRPTDRENDALAESRRLGEARVLVRGDPRDGLCGAIAADRALVVPVRSEQHLPSLLVVDRAATARPLDLHRDGANARVLAGFMSVLIENLELRLRRGRAERSGTIDALTGLANRGVGIFALEHALASAKRTKRALCAMMIDLDEFKALNDTFGHLVGDHALRVTSAVLRRTVRGSDTVCRYGGEEFLVILPDTEAEDATILATRLFTAVAETGKAHGLPITCSIGLSSLREDDTLDTLVGRADGALYASKSRGRNRFSADTD
ncbi:MAG: diguanylate cyclase [Planctomycetes bacterium]|nr:diguanylate cyclase [Planctomycetota bacterium]